MLTRQRRWSSPSHTSFTPSRPLSSSPPLPHLALTASLSWPLCLPSPLPCSPAPPSHKWPTSLRARRGHSNLCGRAKGWDVQWPFLVLLAERAVLHANGFCGCCVTLSVLSPPNAEHQGHTAGHYLRQTSVTRWNLFFTVSERRAINFWGC